MSDLDFAIDEINRVLVGNKSREVEEVYLRNAVRYINEFKEQPELNENQEKYLELLKSAYEKFGNVHDGIFFSLVDYKKDMDYLVKRSFKC